MADQSANADDEGDGDVPRRKVNIMVAGGIVGLLVIIAAAVFFSFRFVESERTRVLQEWQIRLGIVADSRAADVNEWIETNLNTIAELTENQSLQLYMSELSEAGDASQVPDSAASQGYLRNLLIAISDRSGFSPPPPAQETNSNVERAGVSGMALTDSRGNAIVVTPEMPGLSGRLRQAAAKALDGEPGIVDLYKGSSNEPTMGFALPVYGIQDEGGTKGIGVAFGVRVVDEELFDRLKQPGDTSKTAETYLVRKSATTVDYLSPLRDGTPPLKRSVALDSTELAAAFALEKPGGFGLKRNYLGEEVLVTSRAIADLPWVLVRTITREEALAANEDRQRNILIVFILIIVGVTVTMIAVWRHGTSLRAEAAAEKFRISSERFENMSKFMRVVTNSQPTAIVAVDGTTTYTFANEPAGAEAGIMPEDMMGKNMASVMGPVKAKHFSEINKDLLNIFAEAEEQGMENSVQQTRQSHIQRFETEDGDIEVIKSDHIPLRGDRDHPPGILMILDDITEYSREQLKSEARLRQMVSTLTNVVDRRDPASAGFSNKVAEVARSIAEEMECAKIDVDTAEFAGNLRGLGNIYIPSTVLAQSRASLSEEEMAELERSYRVSAELIDGVDFEGPVVEVIKQSGEHMDGSGPMGLAGDDIHLMAKIVAVADTFVELVSPHTDAPAETFEEATNELLQQSGTLFDRKVVTALLNHIENHGGETKWAYFREDTSGLPG